MVILIYELEEWFDVEGESIFLDSKIICENVCIRGLVMKLDFLYFVLRFKILKMIFCLVYKFIWDK